MPGRTSFIFSAAVLALCASAGATSPLRLRIDEGHNINSLLREDQVAAHLLLRSGTQPRILVAFPAGNSGVGLWFETTTAPVAWTLVGEPRAITAADARGRTLRGIEAEATINVSALNVEEAVLSSVRVLRDYEALRKAPVDVLTLPSAAGSKLSWSRDRLDGAPGYQLSIEALGDARAATNGSEGSNGARDSVATVSAREGTPLRLRIRALSGELPLTPLDDDALLTSAARPDGRARDALAFLSYREKLLAGSWRFNTYFGRDTLMSVRLLAPVFQPVAFESGLGAVLTRLAPNGEVAHEEDIGEFAVLRNRAEGRGARDTPIYDYGMIDDDFMLPPVAAHWLLDTKMARERGAAFLAERTEVGLERGDALVRNLLWVVDHTADFAVDPQSYNLVEIKRGRTTGQWRDSETGLAYGRYAYDVNAVFVPAALGAIDRLLASKMLDPYLKPDSRGRLQRADAQWQVWSQRAPAMFVVTVPAEQARAAVSAYATAIGVAKDSALAALPDTPLTFDALALDAAGRPIPVVHSDGGFALLFTQPAASEVQRIVDAMMRPFPAGLLTPVGLLVANPALAARQTWTLYGNDDYHGTVVWSWQQAVLLAGLDRQLSRTDLPAALHARLLTARSQLQSVIERASSVRNSELWSWSFSNGTYHVEPFGKRRTDADESNAVQLWSTVYLGFAAARSGLDDFRDPEWTNR